MIKPIIASSIVALSFMASAIAMTEPQIVNTTSDTLMQKRIDSTTGFCGGDAAYSIPITPARTVWLFGDSFVGTIKEGKRHNCQMIRNCVAIDNPLEPGSKLQYQCGTKSFFKAPGTEQEYLWPGDGTMIDGKLYLFMHSVMDNKTLPAPYQFELKQNYLVVVQNPFASPSVWRYQTIDMGSTKEMLAGTACYQKGAYLYIYSSLPDKAEGKHKHPTALARVSTNDLKDLDLSKMQWWQGKKWGEDRKEAAIVFDDGASEMSVVQPQGLKDLYAVYIPPDGQSINIRRASSPQGPWSAPGELFKLPVGKDMLFYSAKVHPQYKGKVPGQIKVTYNTNSTDFNRLLADSTIYFPKALSCTIKE